MKWCSISMWTLCTNSFTKINNRVISHNTIYHLNSRNHMNIENMIMYYSILIWFIEFFDVLFNIHTASRVLWFYSLKKMTTYIYIYSWRLNCWYVHISLAITRRRQRCATTGTLMSAYNLYFFPLDQLSACYLDLRFFPFGFVCWTAGASAKCNYPMEIGPPAASSCRLSDIYIWGVLAATATSLKFTGFDFQNSALVTKKASRHFPKPSLSVCVCFRVSQREKGRSYSIPIVYWGNEDQFSCQRWCGFGMLPAASSSLGLLHTLNPPQILLKVIHSISHLIF